MLRKGGLAGETFVEVSVAGGRAWGNSSGERDVFDRIAGVWTIRGDQLHFLCEALGDRVRLVSRQVPPVGYFYALYAVLS